MDEIDRLRQQVKELDELRREANIPVKYYHHGGVVSAVYGTSSIAYVEEIQRRLAVAEGQIAKLDLKGGVSLP